MTETRGDKAAAPLGVADRPAAPLEEVPYALIRKRFGANIDNTDVTDISVLGFAGINRVSGLDVYLGSLTAMVGGFMPLIGSRADCGHDDRQRYVAPLPAA